MDSDEPVFDLHVESRFKNAILYRLLKENFGSIAKTRQQMAQGNHRSAVPLINTAAIAIGVHVGALSALLCLNMYPYAAKTGEPKSAVLKIAEYFDMPVENIFPKSLYNLKLPRKVEREYASEQMLSLAAAQREGVKFIQDFDHELNPDSSKDAIDGLLRTLSPREEKIIKMRFGLNDGEEPKNLEEIGQHFAVGKERIRQIEAKALRRLRHPALRSLLSEQIREKLL